MTQEELTNSLAYQATIEAINRYKANKRLHIESFVEGVDYGYGLAIEYACEWLDKHIPWGETSREEVVECINDLKKAMEQ